MPGVLVIISGIEMQQKNMHYPVLVCTTNVPNLQRIEQMEHGIGIKVGANVTIARLEHFLKNTVEKFSGSYLDNNINIE